MAPLSAGSQTGLWVIERNKEINKTKQKSQVIISLQSTVNIGHE